MNPSSFLVRLKHPAPLLLVLASAALAVGAYLQALNYPFIYDDTVYITNNHKLAGLHLTELWRLFVEPYNDFSEFLPLRDFSYWFDMTLFGLNPAAFRLHNILLYLLCLPLVYATTSSLWRYFRPAEVTGAPWVAAAVTALFAVNPVLVESVVWISGRKYMLPNLLSMLALWLAVKARREQGLSPAYAAATLAAFFAVMLSKATYVPLAPVIAMLWVIFWRDIPAPDRRRPLLLWPLAILFLAVILVRIFIVSSKENPSIYLGIEVVTRTLAVLGWLVRLAVSPEGHRFSYPVLEDPWLPAMVALGAAALAAATWGAVTILRRRSLEGFALVAFMLLCTPYINLIPYAPPSLVSDRFLSLAVWPAALLIVTLAWRLKPLPRTALLLAIALPWAFQTVERTHDWRSYDALVDADLRAYPGHYIPAFQKIMGIQLVRGLNRDAIETASSITSPEIKNILIGLIKTDYAVRADAIDTGDPHKAMAMLLEVGLLLKQTPAQTRWDLPMLHVWKYCRSALAQQWYYLAEHFPDDVSVRYNAGVWMLDIRHYRDAATQLRAATESQHLPESVRGTAFKNLGLALLRDGHAAEAEAPLRAALAQPQPDLRAYCLLSEVYEKTRRFEEAARAEADCRNRAPDEKTVQ